MEADAGDRASIDVVSSADALDAVAGEWEALWGRSPRAPVFQHPDWLRAWWRHFGGAGMWTPVVRRDGDLIGIFPLFVWTAPDGTRQVTPIGNGVSDRVDLLADPSREREAAEAVLAWLASNRDRWDTADFRDLPPDSPLLDVAPPAEIERTVEDDEPSPVLALPASSDEMDQAVPREFLKKLRYYRRRLERESAVSFERATAETLEEMMDALARLHSARWAERGKRGVLDDAATRAFHLDASSALDRRGFLRLYAMRVDGRIVAAHYGFAAKGRALYYLGGFDPAHERRSVGTVMVGHALDEAVREGTRELDFLRGREPYKYAWGAVDRPARRIRLRVRRSA